MPFDQHVPRALTPTSIRNFAPIASGVYGVSNAREWIYIGETDDIDGRIRRHQDGRACAYTAARLPVRLVYLEEFVDRVTARRREAQLKKWTRRKKEALVAGNPQLLKKL